MRAAGAQKAPLLPGRGPAHDPDRPACGSSVRDLQYFQCHDPVLDQLLRRGRGRGEHGGRQSRLVHLYGLQLRLSRLHDLYQPESRRGQAGAHQARLPRLHPDSPAHRRADVRAAVLLRPTAARHLHCKGRPGLCLRHCQRHGARDVYGHDLFRLRHHGDVLRHGARAWPELDADGRDDLRCVRAAHHLDLHDLPDAPHA